MTILLPRLIQGVQISAMGRPGMEGSSNPARESFSGSEYEHEPVMVDEILADLQLAKGATVVDGTLGLGGHTERFIREVHPGGKVVGFDWDESMLERARARLGEPEGVRLVLVHDDFRNMSDSLSRLEIRPNGILLDLGLNSAQVDDASRGFSFREPGPLDMRMDRASGEPASAVLNRMTPAQLERAIFDYGDERWARAISRAIVERRQKAPLKTTDDLVECVLAAIPVRAREKRIHPATRTFQAIRILVNGELEGLEEAVTDAALCLAAGGVLCVLSYHSGEDRIVKNVFRNLAKDGFDELHKKPMQPTDAEIRRNSRSRSAKLRSLKRAPLGAKG